MVKPAMSDTIHGSIYADNWFAMYINGKLVSVDSIDFLPHNVVNVDILPEYPMTIAVLAKDNAELLHVLYDGPMMALFEQLVGGDVLHFDYTWFRAVSPGRGTPPHMDIVYMGRGTQRLYTAWTPIGDVPLETGGLIVLEHSHKHDRLNAGYGSKDVDTFCENRRDPGFTQMGGGGNIRAGGALSNNPVKLRERLGGRWLTADFRAGDVLIFSVFLVHASLDNHSQSIRLSSDSRYQSASEPADHRWIGPNPIAHGPEGKRGMIC